MKSWSQCLILSTLLLSASPLFATEGGSSTTMSSGSTSGDGSLRELIDDFLNLGRYLGYNLEKDPTKGDKPKAVSDESLPMTQEKKSQLNAFIDNLLGALPVNTALDPGKTPTFVPPQGNETYQKINMLANRTFKTYSAGPSTQGISYSSLIDQETRQNDPVSQAVLNILSTPDFSYCLDNEGRVLAPLCAYKKDTPESPAEINKLNASDVMKGVIGTPPGTTQYFSFAYNKPLLSELNTNSLIAPLMYSTESSSPPSPYGGLTAGNQMQQAANFIRYATGEVAPIALPTYQAYRKILERAHDTQDPLQQSQAQAALAKYLVNLRIYASQSSVGIANLYYILSKRMPQRNESSSAESPDSSQALNEFTMATWRLYNPNKTANNDWLAQINQASAATIQKEMAILLAEINYQLYLNRQEQERLLLTNTMLLIEATRSAPPNPAALLGGGTEQ